VHLSERHALVRPAVQKVRRLCGLTLFGSRFAVWASFFTSSIALSTVDRWPRRFRNIGPVVRAPTRRATLTRQTNTQTDH